MACEGPNLFLLAGSLLGGDSLALLLISAVGLGLFLRGVLIDSFWRFVTHGLRFRPTVCSPLELVVSPKGTPRCLLAEALANILGYDF